MGMDILSDYRITALLVNERELATRVERARIADERAARPAERPVTSTRSLVCIPATN
jgi:hypothetical protein